MTVKRGDPHATLKFVLALGATVVVVIAAALVIKYALRWVIGSWDHAALRVPRRYRTYAYAGGLGVALATGWASRYVQRLARRIPPPRLGDTLDVVALVGAVATVIGAFLFALVNAVPRGGPAALLWAFGALAVLVVALFLTFKR